MDNGISRLPNQAFENKRPRVFGYNMVTKHNLQRINSATMMPYGVFTATELAISCSSNALPALQAQNN